MLVRDVHVASGATLGFPTGVRTTDLYGLARDMMLVGASTTLNIVITRIVESRHMGGLGNNHALVSSYATVAVKT